MASSDIQTISDLSHQCISNLNHLVVGLQDRQYTVRLGESAVDERGRFRVWAANLGALQEPRSTKSLDFRLKDASRMQQSVKDGLSRLESSAQRVNDIVSNKRPNRTPSNTSSNISSSNVNDNDGQTPVRNELEELMLNLHSSINHLFSLSILIRRRRPKGRTPGPLSSSSPDDSPDHSPDIVNVGDKFPKARQARWLAQRLGNAITHRRRFIQYRQDHRERLTTRPTEDDAAPLLDDTAVTLATTYEETFQAAQASQAAQNQFQNVPSDQRSLFTFATSFASMAEENDGLGRQIPDLSDMTLNGVKLEYGEAFECPYCRTIQMVPNRLGWKKHVFEDLQPYLCTFQDCTSELFSTRHEWFKHEMETHRRRWHCNQCNSSAAVFVTDANLKQHIEQVHPGRVTEAQMPLILQACERQQKCFNDGSCPLCESWHPSPSVLEDNSKEFCRHLARHLQLLALEALPLAIEGLEIQQSEEESGKTASTDGSEASASSEDEEYPEQDIQRGGSPSYKLQDDMQQKYEDLFHLIRCEDCGFEEELREDALACTRCGSYRSKIVSSTAPPNQSGATQLPWHGNKKGHVLYNYTARAVGEMSILVGDEVIIVDDTVSEGWWQVRKVKNGQMGLVPSSYVEVTSQASDPAESARMKEEQLRREEEKLARLEIQVQREIYEKRVQLLKRDSELRKIEHRMLRDDIEAAMGQGDHLRARQLEEQLNKSVAEGEKIQRAEFLKLAANEGALAKAEATAVARGFALQDAGVFDGGIEDLDEQAKRILKEQRSKAEAAKEAELRAAKEAELRREEEKLREIEERVQREIAVKREELLAKEEILRKLEERLRQS